MKKRFFIMKYYLPGNIGPHRFEKINEQKEGGYIDYDAAFEAMNDLRKEGNYDLNNYREFSIIEIISFEKNPE